LLTDLSDRLVQADPNDYSGYTGTTGIALLLQLAAHRQVGGLFNPKDLLQVHSPSRSLQSLWEGTET